MLQKTLLCLFISLTVGLTTAFACDCIGSAEYTREIKDLTKTAEEEGRFVVLVEILSKGTKTIDFGTVTFQAQGYFAQVLEVLGGCIDDDQIFIADEGGGCSDLDLFGIEIGDTGLVLGFEDDKDYVFASDCDTRSSYYNVENNKLNTRSGIASNELSLDKLRDFNGCSLSYTIYPNPASELIRITRDDTPISASAGVTIIDESGRVAQLSKGPTVALDQLSAGTYFISVGNSRNVIPLVVVH
ncbi:MAG: T9SS type A sorting domain-containing protein [Saprospiraceae bacterium]